MTRPILLFTSVGFGVASFIIAFSLGSILTATTNIPLIGGLLNGVLTAMVLTIGLLATRFTGTATLMWLVFAACATITTTLGPPGIYKIAIGFTAGVIWDAIYALFRKRTIGLFLGAILGSASIMFALVVALSLGFGRNPDEALSRYQDAFAFILIINLLVTLAGVYLGYSVFRNRLSKLQAFKNLRQDAH